MSDELVSELTKDVREIRAHVLEIKETLAEQRGERRVALWAAGVIGGISGAALLVGAKFAPFLAAIRG